VNNKQKKSPILEAFLKNQVKYFSFYLKEFEPDL